MIVVSSFRPFTDPTCEHGRNQIRAHESWINQFDTIVYFNEPNRYLDKGPTIFVESENYPRIQHLAKTCSEQSDWCALVNADIVIGDRFRLVERRLKRSTNACAGVSWRWTFDPGFGTSRAEVNDFGLDFFCAAPDMWARASVLVHPHVRIGCQSWDTQMLSFFATYAMHGFYDLTPARVVFHPVHGNRNYGPCVPPTEIRVWGAPVMPHAKIQ